MERAGNYAGRGMRQSGVISRNSSPGNRVFDSFFVSLVFRIWGKHLILILNLVDKILPRYVAAADST
jgi:hypothetical protein